jgi:hypothetical protein
MKNKGYTLDHVCCSVRDSISAPYLDVSGDAGATLIATNGRILVAIKVDETDGDVSGYIPRGVLSKRAIGNIQVSNNGVKVGLVSFSLQKEMGTFPQWRTCAPKSSEVSRRTLNVKLLKDLLKAVPPTVATVEVVVHEADLDPVELRHDSAGFLGWIMPVSDK